jgi:magnesium/cobalt transport protein CorA
MPIRAYLYDATSTDREVTPTAEVIAALHDRQLLWIDVSAFEDAELRQVAKLANLTRESVYALFQAEHRPRLDSYGTYVQLNINTIQEHDGHYRQVQVDFILAPNLVITIHRKPVAFLESFDRRVKSDSDWGELDAATLLAALLDWHVTAYFRVVEDLEINIDRIDAHALRPRHRRDLLSEMAYLRQRVAYVRRALTPHREVYAALARPDFQTMTKSDSQVHFGTLLERLERAIDAVENARELLIGSFDIFTTQTNLRTNEAIKLLTLVSFVWLPASVIIGITALLVRTPLDPLGSFGFWMMIGSIALIAVFTLIFARMRRWI